MTDTADFFDPDDALNHSPPPAKSIVRYGPDPPPAPIFVAPRSPETVPENVSTPSSETARKRSNRRKKTRPPQGLDHLVMTMDPNRPDIANAVRANPVLSASVSEDSGSEEEADMADFDADEDLAGRRDTNEEIANRALHNLKVDGSTGEHHHAARDILAAASAATGSRRPSSDVLMSPAKRARYADLPDASATKADEHGSGDAVDALVTLRERSPKRLSGRFSPRPSSPPWLSRGIDLTNGARDNVLPAMLALNTTPGLNSWNGSSQSQDKPSLPPMSEFVRIAEEGQQSQSLRARAGRAPSYPSFSIGNRHSPSLAGASGPSRPSPRSPDPIPSPQRLQHSLQTQRAKDAAFQPGRASSSKTGSERSAHNQHLQNPALSSLSPPGGQADPRLHQHQNPLDRRASHASERTSAFTPAQSEESPYSSRISHDDRTSSEAPSFSEHGMQQEGRMDAENGGSPGQSKNQAASSVRYPCPVPGCDAAPFATQYLLKSHSNVHSDDRPHYCSDKDCPHSEGGEKKGFKRRNELKRHRLVHEPPRYVCPFCPDKQRSYPRPDNLQRHCKVHHTDKPKDDPALKEVLSQRSAGSSRGGRQKVK
ncbi:MAG: hypothetical protein M1825_000106 [Sarcosagium campestre]|nr:MAG: hypothetical protein M1825_000106 [Sarcosagium campestre]